MENSNLQDKNILLGITGSIAAYKSAEVIRLLRKRKAKVYPIMTRAATNFVHPVTFQSLASQEVVLDSFSKNKEIKHISLSSLADLFLIAPATANVIGKIACGIADDILTTTVLACQSPVLIAPAMNHRMWINPILQQNVKKLKSLGFKFVGPMKGKLASGEVGEGRMSEPSQIVDYVEKIFSFEKDFRGKTFLITAGPTRERLDRVRFLSNYSTGKMGYALAEEGKLRGAKIILISGPTFLNVPSGVEFYRVESAEQMKSCVIEKFPEVDGVIMAAAVADFTPLKKERGKIKKDKGEKIFLELKRTPDILAKLGRIKQDKILVGFCAETKDLEKEAKKKLKLKNLDLIVANNISSPGAGFAVDTNVVSLIDKKGEVKSFPKLTKREVAEKIWDKIKEMENQP
ncbi:bifunctional phosphopantothenoylcysteine decarboxylase/phosphopantothenate--cysteine ligase CoaBC [Candidatus Aerophobetes bacterium]|nr:bifunctional phosphopantothenoylcysteine decarboxylase/phosphopantothenate--cysteine ligase CoaBC [Candidatus Aerophobetes bacterium]